MLDNVRSAWNVGAIFRTADGLGVRSLYLCGNTPTPDNESVRKTALGAEETVTWKYSRNVLEITKELHNDGHTLVALEQNEYAKPIGMYPVLPRQQVALIVGNEITGVDPQLLDLCDHILYIPMHGKKRSLNVEVAFAIAVYALRSQMV
ncbi:MAG: RNA methyltransferase [Anaerolineales bacterium]